MDAHAMIDCDRAAEQAPLVRPAERGPRWRSITHVICAFIVVAAGNSSLPGVSLQTVRAGTILVLAFWLMAALRHIDFSTRVLGPLAFVAGGAIAFLIVDDRDLWSLAAVSILFGLFRVLSFSRVQPISDTLARLVPTWAGLAVLFQWCALANPRLWEPITRLAISWGEFWTATAFGQRLELGPSAQAWPESFALALLLVLHFLWVSRNVKRALLGLVILLVGQIGFLGILVNLPTQISSTETLTILPIVFQLAVGLPIAFMVTRPGDGLLPAGGRLRSALLTSGLAIAMFAVSLVSPIISPQLEARVLFYAENEGNVLDFRVPDFQRFGLYSQGMFGLLPRYLEEDGFEVAFCRGEVDAKTLEGTSVFVLTNVDTDWQKEELLAIWNWVEEGGTLLLLGDHTDVGGTRRSQNSVLLPAGIELRFDSSVPSEWVGWSRVTLFPSVLSSSLSGSPTLMSLGVGATLKIDPMKATPLVWARQGLADLGDGANPDGAFLGDYKYQRGERAGDLVLVAESRFGDGRFVVFGDTGPFQNASVPDTWEMFVRPAFAAFSGKTTFDLGLARHWISILFVLTLLLAVRFVGPRPIAIFALGSALAIASTGARALCQVELPPSTQPTAWIDLSHAPRVDFRGDGRNPVGGLLLNLQRNGFRAQFADSFPAERLKPGSALVVLAPAVGYQAHEISAIREFVENGGLLIVASGFFERSGSQDLLAEFGFAIGNTPLGAIPMYRYEDVPRSSLEFRDAWPIESVAAPQAVTMSSDTASSLNVRRDNIRDNNTRVMAAHAGIPIGVLRRVDRGGVFVVGDSWFFSSQNLEGSDGIVIANLRLLKELFDEFKAWGSLNR